MKKFFHRSLEDTRQSIDLLRRSYPEVMADDDIRPDALFGETNAYEQLEIIGGLIQEAASMQVGLRQRLRAMQRRLDRWEKNEEAWRHEAFKLLDLMGERTAQFPEYTIFVRDGGPKVIITDEDQLPEAYFRWTSAPDLAKIREALKTGPVAGATLSNSPPSLTLSPKVEQPKKEV